jgi:hypothetical protein
VPARPSGKARFSEGKAFGSGKGRMKIGARREVEQESAGICVWLINRMEDSLVPFLATVTIRLVRDKQPLLCLS